MTPKADSVSARTGVSWLLCLPLLAGALAAPAADAAGATASFASASQEVREGSGTVDVKVSAERVAGPGLTLAYTIAGTATAGMDYKTLSGTVTVPAGATTATIPVTVVDDGEQERAESVVLTLAAVTVEPALVRKVRARAARTHRSQARVDRWRRVLVAFGVETYPGLAPMTAAEAEANAQRYSSPLWPQIATALAAEVGSPGTHTLTIADDDLPVLSVADAEGTEHSGLVIFTLRLSAPLVYPTTVHVATRDSTPASATGEDYWPEDYELGLTPGQTEFLVPVVVFDDSHDEGAETFELVLSADGGVTIGDGVAVGTITDDDPPLPVVSIAAWSGSVGEGGDAVFTVTADRAPADADLQVALSVSESGGGDRVAAGDEGSATAVIPKGLTEGTLVVATADDGADEADGTVTVTVAAGDGYAVGDPATASVSVEDDDLPLPVVSIAAKSGSVAEGGDAVFTVTADRAPDDADLAVALSVSESGGGDRVAASDKGAATVVIPKFETEGTFVLATADDGTDEEDGTVTVTVAAGDGYAVGDPATASVSVEDDDLPLPVVSIAAKSGSVAEGGDAVFTVMADRAPDDADLQVALSVSESGGGDRVAAGDEGSATAVIPKGLTEGTLVVATADDGADEADGTVTVTVAAGDGYAVGDPATASVSVEDDDLPLPVVSVADAEGAEHSELVIFTVRLSTPLVDPASVHVATRDSTPVSATASKDYWATPGKDYWAVDFWSALEPGQTEFLVTVLVFDDSHDEGAETFELVLSAPNGGVTIGDGVAVGTITNDDPMPAAWLARFGRGVAEQALEGVSDRLDAPRGARGLRGTVAGVPLGFGVAGGAARHAAHPGLGAAPGAVPGEFGGGASMAGSVAAGAGAGRSPSGGRLSWGGAEDAGGGTLGLWGRASRSRFDGRDGALALDGETATTLLGADYARGRWLAGVALARSRGEGAYRAAGAAAGDCAGDDAERGACMAAAGGAVSSSLTAAIPYASLRASERLRLWGAAGAGVGEVSLAASTASTSWRMAAAGLRGDLLGGGAGPALAVVSDALWTRTASAAARGLAASDSGTSRLRLGLEGRWELPVPGGGRLTPSLEVGARRDGGDAETGLGVELGGGLAWRQPSLGIALDLSGRTLVSHADGAAESRGLSASLAYDPTPASARGLSLSLRQHRGGQAAGGLDALFAGDPLARRPGGGRDADAGRWTMEAGWGAAVFGGRFVGTPHVGLGGSAFGRDLSVGWRLVPEAAAAPDLSLGLTAARREGSADAPEHGVAIEMSVRW